MGSLTEVFMQQVLDGTYRYKILNQSPSGKGKTWLAASAAKAFGKTYFFDFDDRIQSLSSSAYADLDIEYDTYPVSKPSSYDKAYDKLLRFPTDIKVVVLDTTTSLNDLSMTVAMPSIKEFYKPNHAKMSSHGIEVPAMPDYQGSGVLVQKFVERVCSLPCHVIVNAHELLISEPKTNTTFVKMDVPSKLQARLPGKFNEIWRSDCETPAIQGVITPKYVVRVKPNNMYGCRTCWSKALNEIEPADLEIIHGKVVKWCREESARRGAGLGVGIGKSASN